MRQSACLVINPITVDISNQKFFGFFVFALSSLNMLTVCVRNNLGRELAQSDRLLSHTFSTGVTYSEVMLICDFDFIFRSIFKLF